MKKTILPILCAALALPAAAHADAGPGYVSSIFTILDDHSVAFNQSGSRSNIPGCGQGLSLRWVIDASTPYGQSELSVILSAYALHKPVAISGTGDCGVHGDTETARYINIIDS